MKIEIKIAGLAKLDAALPIMRQRLARTLALQAGCRSPLDVSRWRASVLASRLRAGCVRERSLGHRHLSQNRGRHAGLDAGARRAYADSRLTTHD